MNGLRVALLVINSLISSVGIVANLVLLIIISVATPKPIRTYSVLIVNYAVTDLFTSLAQALTVPRYFSLRYGVPKRKPIIILCFITCLPSLVPMLVLCQKWANESTVANLIAKYRGDMYDDGLAVAARNVQV
ncbi:hypothetical protein ANCDUO_05838 [Ancylostoma duodenale]|uniref:G-protein coupled receptors family 1 profile domain-containing protein n=1 Tax=Ancylostoma duodenale TaxID=51022 RepID=A0A0C2H379_9BILA|nr:hypothetical protein ANCDUO_05838 [Ancylostoma duodenale]